MKIINLKAAKSKELKRYFTGEPCKYGHVCERYTCSRRCVECMRIFMRRPDQRARLTIYGRIWRSINIHARCSVSPSRHG